MLNAPRVISTKNPLLEDVNKGEKVKTAVRTKPLAGITRLNSSSIEAESQNTEILSKRRRTKQENLIYLWLFDVFLLFPFLPTGIIIMMMMMILIIIIIIVIIIIMCVLTEFCGGWPHR